MNDPVDIEDTIVVPAEVAEDVTLNSANPISKGLVPTLAVRAFNTVIEDVWLDNITLLLFTLKLPLTVILPVN